MDPSELTLSQLIRELVRLRNYCDGRYPGRESTCMMQVETPEGPVTGPVEKAKVIRGNQLQVRLFSPHPEKGPNHP